MDPVKKAVSFELAPGATHPVAKVIETPKPNPRPGQVLVCIEYTDLSHFDFEAMNGDPNKQLAKQLSKNEILSGIEMAGIARDRW
jgi:NADPH:quinone reductase-like Zn-dependent oxidoreductase